MSRREWAAVAAITAVALALRLVYASQSLLGDEFFTYEIATKPSLGDVFTGIDESESTPPLIYVLTWLAAKLGDAADTIRLPSLVLGTATVPVLFLLARRAGGTPAGLIAAGALALSPFALYYGSEARAYAAAAFFVTVAALLLLAALERDSRRWWAALAAAIAAAALTHYTAGFALAWLGLWALLFRRERWRAVVVTFAAAGAAFAAWLPFAQEGAAPFVIGVFAPLTLGNVGYGLSHAMYGLPAVPISDAPGLPAVVVLYAVTLAAAGGLALRVSRGVKPELVLLAGLAVATPVGVLAYSLVSSDLFIARNLFVSVPAAFACIGAGLAALPALPRVAAVAAGAVALGVAAASGDGDRGRRPAFGEVANYVESRTAPADPVVEVEVLPDGPIRDGLEVEMPEGRPVLEVDTDAARIRGALRGARRFALVRSEAILGGGPPPLTIDTRGFRPGERREFPGAVDLDVTVYERVP